MLWILLVGFTAFIVVNGNIHLFKQNWNHYDKKYSTFTESERLAMLQEAKEMFYFGYDNYMKYAFPRDELDPIHCTGRGPDKENPSNININDVLGDYALTLVDALDTLAIMGNSSEFHSAVQLIVNNVSFEKPSTVQVFEATIRVMGGLISAHLIISDPEQPFGAMAPSWYDNELLHLAHDLGSRLLPAFEATGTGIPYPRVNLQHGVPENCMNETCLAGAGSLLLEFGLLSRLLQDPVYESVARRSIRQLWKLKSNVTGLFGNVVNIQTGEWIGIMSGLGAGLDSFFEYLLKAYIMFGDDEYLQMFNESYETIKFYMRKGRKDCNSGSGFPPIYVNVHMRTGEVINNWIDALQAAWPAVQLLKGDLEEAICLHALYYTIWQRYGALPERYNWNLKGPDVNFYPLRPELVESTYLLYQATKNPFYMHVGRDILNSLNNHTRVQCGYATIHNVLDKTNEDRMESFFLSETCKYLYLLFDTDNHLNKAPTKYLFSTEGHIFPLKYHLRQKTDVFRDYEGPKNEVGIKETEKSSAALKILPSNYSTGCETLTREKQYFLPVESQYLQQMASIVGLGSS